MDHVPHAAIRCFIRAAGVMALLAASPGAATADAGQTPAPAQVPAPAPAQASTQVHIGIHPTFGRLVFDLSKGAGFDVATDQNRVLVVFRDTGPLAAPAGLPRNVTRLQMDADTATLVLAPGAQMRSSRFAGRLVLDFYDPVLRSAPGRPSDPPADQIGAGKAFIVPLSGPAAADAAAKPPASPRREPEAPLPKVEHGPPGPAAAPIPAAVPAPPAPPPHVREAAGHVLPMVPPPPKPTPSPAAEAGLAKAPDAAPVAPVLKEYLATARPAADSHGTADPAADKPPASPAPPVLQTPPAPPPPASAPARVLLRADADVGAAAFRRGPLGVVVFDRRMPLDAPVDLPGATVAQGAVSTVLSFPLPPDEALTLARAENGWALRIVKQEPEAALQPEQGPESLVFTLLRAGRAVAVLDPLTGGTLLVGVSLAAGPATALRDARRTPGYALLPTWQGVVVEPLSDRVDLRASAPGFLLIGAPPLPALPPMAQSGQTGGKRFDLPNEPPAALMNRMQAQLASAAAAPPRARARDRMAAAQTMMALGMGLEAQSLIQIAAVEDPQAASDARLLALSAIAAVMAGRLDEAEGLDDPRLDEPGAGAPAEVMLWRGIRDRRRGQSTAATARLPSLAPLVLAYPETLRRVIWPEVAEAAVEAGVPVAADMLPPLSKATLLERQGKVDEALAAYAAIDAGADRLNQVKAAARLTELKLASGRIAPAAAADAMERLSFAWRGDAREAGLRLRAAELRAAAGGWRPALDALRQIETLFPDQKQAVQARKISVFSAMLESQGSGMSPLDVVLLAAEYSDCVPEGPPGAALAALLADKLLALDLPARAIPVLQGLMRGAPAGPARAEFGNRLAHLLLEGGESAAAMAALQTSAAPGMPPALQEARALLTARVQAAQGDAAGAASGLQELGTAPADDLRATILAAAGDLPGSMAALSDLAAKLVPATGALPDAAQAVLMRQATAASRLPDPALLRVLERNASRMTGPRADVFRVLTAPPLTTTMELPRAAKELTMARAIPQRLQALGVK